MPRKTENRLQVLETRHTRPLGFRIFTQDLDNPSHYYEGKRGGCVAPGLGRLGPYTQADIDKLRAQGWACVVICYEDWPPTPVWG